MSNNLLHLHFHFLTNLQIMLVRLSALLTLGIMLSINSMAQSDPVMQRIVEIGNGDNRTMAHLDILCNRFGGRLIGSDAYENAALWAASKFEEWGMEVIMDEVGELPVGFKIGRAHV